MSLVKTLGRVAMGVVVAKGVGKLMDSRRGGSNPAGQSGSGKMLSGGSGGGLAGMLGGLLGGQSTGQAGSHQGGGLGGMLGGGSGSTGGGLAGGLGSLLGGRSGAAGSSGSNPLSGGGLGGLLERIGGGATGSAGTSASPPSSGSLGDLLNRALQGESAPEPDAGQEALARVLIQAMVNAAKADGTIDDEERARIVEHLGEDTTAEERDFVLGEMRAPLDLDGFLRTVPRGAERQVYTMSLMAIELDEPAEARYLDSLRKGMNLSEQDADAIHRELGVDTLYS